MRNEGFPTMTVTGLVWRHDRKPSRQHTKRGIAETLENRFSLIDWSVLITGKGKIWLPAKSHKVTSINNAFITQAAGWSSPAVQAYRNQDA